MNDNHGRDQRSNYGRNDRRNMNQQQQRNQEQRSWPQNQNHQYGSNQTYQPSYNDSSNHSSSNHPNQRQNRHQNQQSRHQENEDPRRQHRQSHEQSKEDRKQPQNSRRQPQDPLAQQQRERRHTGQRPEQNRENRTQRENFHNQNEDPRRPHAQRREENREDRDLQQNSRRIRDERPQRAEQNREDRTQPHNSRDPRVRDQKMQRHEENRGDRDLQQNSRGPNEEPRIRDERRQHHEENREDRRQRGRNQDPRVRDERRQHDQRHEENRGDRNAHQNIRGENQDPRPQQRRQLMNDHEHTTNDYKRGRNEHRQQRREEEVKSRGQKYEEYNVYGGNARNTTQNSPHGPKMGQHPTRSEYPDHSIQNSNQQQKQQNSRTQQQFSPEQPRENQNAEKNRNRRPEQRFYNSKRRDKREVPNSDRFNSNDDGRNVNHQGDKDNRGHPHNAYENLGPNENKRKNNSRNKRKDVARDQNSQKDPWMDVGPSLEISEDLLSKGNTNQNIFPNWKTTNKSSSEEDEEDQKRDEIEQEEMKRDMVDIIPKNSSQHEFRRSQNPSWGMIDDNEHNSHSRPQELNTGPSNSRNFQNSTFNINDPARANDRRDPTRANGRDTTRANDHRDPQINNHSPFISTSGTNSMKHPTPIGPASHSNQRETQKNSRTERRQDGYDDSRNVEQASKYEQNERRKPQANERSSHNRGSENTPMQMGDEALHNQSENTTTNLHYMQDDPNDFDPNNDNRFSSLVRESAGDDSDIQGILDQNSSSLFSRDIHNEKNQFFPQNQTLNVSSSQNESMNQNPNHQEEHRYLRDQNQQNPIAYGRTHNHENDEHRLRHGHEPREDKQETQNFHNFSHHLEQHNRREEQHNGHAENQSQNPFKDVVSLRNADSNFNNDGSKSFHGNSSRPFGPPPLNDSPENELPPQNQRKNGIEHYRGQQNRNADNYQNPSKRNSGYQNQRQSPPKNNADQTQLSNKSVRPFPNYEDQNVTTNAGKFRNENGNNDKSGGFQNNSMNHPNLATQTAHRDDYDRNRNVSARNSSGMDNRQGRSRDDAYGPSNTRNDQRRNPPSHGQIDREEIPLPPPPPPVRNIYENPRNDVRNSKPYDGNRGIRDQRTRGFDNNRRGYEKNPRGHYSDEAGDYNGSRGRFEDSRDDYRRDQRQRNPQSRSSSLDNNYSGSPLEMKRGRRRRRRSHSHSRDEYTHTDSFHHKNSFGNRVRAPPENYRGDYSSGSPYHNTSQKRFLEDSLQHDDFSGDERSYRGRRGRSPNSHSDQNQRRSSTPTRRRSRSPPRYKNNRNNRPVQKETHFDNDDHQRFEYQSSKGGNSKGSGSQRVGNSSSRSRGRRRNADASRGNGKLREPVKRTRGNKRKKKSRDKKPVAVPRESENMNETSTRGNRNNDRPQRLALKPKAKYVEANEPQIKNETQHIDSVDLETEVVAEEKKAEKEKLKPRFGVDENAHLFDKTDLHFIKVKILDYDWTSDMYTVRIFGSPGKPDRDIKVKENRLFLTEEKSRWFDLCYAFPIEKKLELPMKEFLKFVALNRGAELDLDILRFFFDNKKTNKFTKFHEDKECISYNRTNFPQYINRANMVAKTLATLLAFYLVKEKIPNYEPLMGKEMLSTIETQYGAEIAAEGDMAYNEKKLALFFKNQLCKSMCANIINNFDQSRLDEFPLYYHIQIMTKKTHVRARLENMLNDFEVEHKHIPEMIIFATFHDKEKLDQAYNAFPNSILALEYVKLSKCGSRLTVEILEVNQLFEVDADWFKKVEAFFESEEKDFDVKRHVVAKFLCSAECSKNKCKHPFYVNVPHECLHVNSNTWLRRADTNDLFIVCPECQHLMTLEQNQKVRDPKAKIKCYRDTGMSDAYGYIGFHHPGYETRPIGELMDLVLKTFPDFEFTMSYLGLLFFGEFEGEFVAIEIQPNPDIFVLKSDRTARLLEQSLKMIWKKKVEDKNLAQSYKSKNSRGGIFVRKLSRKIFAANSPNELYAHKDLNGACFRNRQLQDILYDSLADFLAVNRNRRQQQQQSGGGRKTLTLQYSDIREIISNTYLNASTFLVRDACNELDRGDIPKYYNLAYLETYFSKCEAQLIQVCRRIKNETLANCI